MELKQSIRMRELMTQLNMYRDAYYNKSESLISDYEYDCLYDELVSLEKETGCVLANSPTQTVGYEVRSKLQKVKHNHPMLSLDKTKSVNDLIKFFGNKSGIMMHKLDGLTVSLRYLDGKLVSAETRGNGEVGEDVTHNAKFFHGVPLEIPYKEELIVDGEAIISEYTLERINKELPEEKKYKNCRNLASGSVRQLDSNIAAERGVEFIAWKCEKGFDDNSFLHRLSKLSDIGFNTVLFFIIYPDKNNEDSLKKYINYLRQHASNTGIPIDGIVCGYDDIEYGKSLGMTGHHPKNQIAYKFYEDEEVTILRDVEWSMGKTGDLTPVAVFDPVELNGTTVSRASMHNVSICRDLQIGIGDEVTVYKANEIIPQIRENLTKSNNLVLPDKCPVCGGLVEVEKSNDTEVLKCKNPTCGGKLLGRLSHAVSRNALNIDGLSETTIEKFISLGWLNSIKDIYHLKIYRVEMSELIGFGEKSADKILTSIEKSRKTSLDRFIYSLSIPLCGRTASRAISKFCKNDIGMFVDKVKMFGENAFTSIDGIGAEIGKSIKSFFDENMENIILLANEFEFESVNVEETNKNNLLEGKIFVITGKLHDFSSRDELKESIEFMGGKVAGSISSKTSYLINNDCMSQSSKNLKARELGIPVITEEEFSKMIMKQEVAKNEQYC
ncbi:MAG: NAD-dependent DNA ligase LigA [Eisenbergiella sp.]